MILISVIDPFLLSPNFETQIRETLPTAGGIEGLLYFLRFCKIYFLIASMKECNQIK